MKPLIGITPLFDVPRESWWIIPGYMQATEQAGGLPVMLPLTEREDTIREMVSRISALLLTGGPDVDPALYGQSPDEKCGEVCLPRDRMEKLLLEEALRRDLPILGVCRGMQLINVHFGGTLYQDLPSQRASDIAHNMTPPYDRTVHSVSTVPGTRLQAIIGDHTGVNTYHHQAVQALGRGLVASAHAPDGTVEAIECPARRFLLAVQWHPEYMFRVDENSRRIFRSFVAAAEEKARDTACP